MSAPGPRQVFCVIEHRHRNREIAEEVCAGRFRIQGVSLDLGLEPDWIGATLPADREWRLEWSKFYYALDLAWAFRQTGDLRFPRAFERLVASWIDRVPVDFDSTDVIARRIQNWIYAWNGFASRPGFAGLDPDLAARIVRSIAAQVHHVRTHLTPERNHRTLELYALFIAALALPELDPDRDLLTLAVMQLHANLLSDILPDGVQRERSTHYHHVVLRSLLGVRENARRFALALPSGFDERLTRACEFAMHAHRPDGLIPALSDSDTGSYLDLLELAGSHLYRSDFIYVGTRGACGAPPVETNVSFPVGGYYIQRSGWGTGSTPLARERFLIFDCGPLGDGGHGHYDALSVEIGAERPLVMDPGRYTYCDDGASWRRRFKSTAAHNTVTVDGLDQTPYRRGKPKGRAASAMLLQRAEAAGVDLLWGEVRSPAYDAIHRRRVIFVGGEYWLIEDRLDAQQPHDYELRFHLAPHAHGRTSINASASGATVLAPECACVLATHGVVTLERGWISPEYGTKLPGPVIVAAESGARAATFITLIAPLQAMTSVPTMSVAEDGVVCTVTVNRPEADGRWRDRVSWSLSGEETALPGFEGRARVAWTRELVTAPGSREARVVAEVAGP